jgi:eukaryotic-like serine/threonine-protein kinase
MPKICPKCYTRFEHEVAFCPNDGQGLIECDAEGETSREDIATCVSRDSEATRTAEALRPAEATPEAAQKDPLVGTTFAGRFQVERLLGRGGMGAVYVAFQDSVERRVALKVLSSECQSEPDLVKRFFFEARVMSQLTNPHTITIYDFAQAEDGRLYIAMELLEGQDLRARLDRDEPLSVDETVRILSGVAESLSEAHAKDIVHRDLKPENIFLARLRDDPMFVKVLDFGIARAHTLEETRLTQTGCIVGTPAYLSPEVVVGGVADTRSDVYALGLIMYEMLAGSAPFKASNAYELMQAHLVEHPETVSKVNPHVQVPRPVSELMMASLSKSPDQRPRDASAFREELINAGKVSSRADTARDPMPQLNVTGAGFCTLGATASALVKPAEAWRFTGSNPIPTHLDSARTTPRRSALLAEGADHEVGAGLERGDLYGEPEAPARPSSSGVALVVIATGGVLAILLVLFFALTAPREAPQETSARMTAPATQPSGEVGERPEETTAPVAASGGADAHEAASADAGAASRPADDAGAASTPPEDTRIVWTIVSEPAGAEVWLDDQRVGVTPHLVRLGRSDQAHQLRLRLEGYEEERWSQTPAEDRLLSRSLKAIPKKPRWRPRPAPTPPPEVEAPVEAPTDGKRNKLKKVLLD